MLRIKKVHKNLLLYCLGLYSFCLVAKLHLLPNEMAPINLSFASRSFQTLSDEVRIKTMSTMETGAGCPPYGQNPQSSI